MVNETSFFSPSLFWTWKDTTPFRQDNPFCRVCKLRCCQTKRCAHTLYLLPVVLSKAAGTEQSQEHNRMENNTRQSDQVCAHCGAPTLGKRSEENRGDFRSYDPAYYCSDCIRKAFAIAFPNNEPHTLTNSQQNHKSKNMKCSEGEEKKRKKEKKWAERERYFQQLNFGVNFTA